MNAAEAEISRRAAELEAALAVAAASARAQQLAEADARMVYLSQPDPPLAAAARWVTGRIAVRESFRARLGPPAPLFDEEFYLQRYPEVARSRLSPIWHYRRHGARAGMQPHALFEPSWYRSQVPGGLAPEDDALEHFFDEGAAAGLDPHPLFATAWYARTFEPGRTNPLVDYLGRWPAGVSPHPLFDAPWYLQRNRAVVGREPLQHFLGRGWNEGRDPRPSFDVRWYLWHSRDVAAAGTNPLVHYLSLIHI